MAHKEKEEAKSESANPSPVVQNKLAREKSNPRIGDSKFEERISRIKAENELLRGGKSEFAGSRAKTGSEIDEPLPEPKYEIKSKYRS